MPATPEAPPGSFTALVATEIRAQLARHRVTGRELGRRLGRPSQWVSMRLQGRIAMDTEDLEQIADALGLAPKELLGQVLAAPPPPARSGGGGGSSAKRKEIELMQ